MRYFRRNTPGRRVLLVSAVVGAVVLAGSAIAYAAYPTNAVTVMTGCLGGGTLKNVAANPTTPTSSCGSMKLVHISGGTITKVSAGAGVTVAGVGGTGYVNNGFAAVSVAPKYQLPQSGCANGQVVTSNGTGGWSCQTPNSGTQVFAGGVLDTGSAASFFIGGSGMTVSWISTGVTRITVTNAGSQPVLSVTAIGGDSTAHCAIGSAHGGNAYDINCFDGGNPWPVSYHVMAVVP